jgi:hypothetical protein
MSVLFPLLALAVTSSNPSARSSRPDGERRE